LYVRSSEGNKDLDSSRGTTLDFAKDSDADIAGFARGLDVSPTDGVVFDLTGLSINVNGNISQALLG